MAAVGGGGRPGRTCSQKEVVMDTAALSVRKGGGNSICAFFDFSRRQLFTVSSSSTAPVGLAICQSRLDFFDKPDRDERARCKETTNQGLER